MPVADTFIAFAAKISKMRDNNIIGRMTDLLLQRSMIEEVYHYELHIIKYM